MSASARTRLIAAAQGSCSERYRLTEESGATIEATLLELELMLLDEMVDESADAPLAPRDEWVRLDDLVLDD